MVAEHRSKPPRLAFLSDLGVSGDGVEREVGLRVGNAEA